MIRFILLFAITTFLSSPSFAQTKPFPGGDAPGTLSNTRNQSLVEDSWTPINFQDGSPRVRSIVVGTLPSLSSGATHVEFRMKGGDGGTGTWDGIFVDQLAQGGEGATVTFTVDLRRFYRISRGTIPNNKFFFFQGKRGESSTHDIIASGGGGGATGIIRDGFVQSAPNQPKSASHEYIAIAGGGGGACSFENFQFDGLPAKMKSQNGVSACGFQGGSGGEGFGSGSNTEGARSKGVNTGGGGGGGRSPGSPGSGYRPHELQGDSFSEGGHGGYRPNKTHTAGELRDALGGGAFDGINQATVLFSTKDIARGGSGFAGGGAGGQFIGDGTSVLDCPEQINPAGAGGGGGGLNGGGAGDKGRGGGTGFSEVASIEVDILGYITDPQVIQNATTSNPQNGYVEYRVIYDVEPPVITCQDIIVSLPNVGVNLSRSVLNASSNGSAVVTPDMVVLSQSDNSGSVNLSLSKSVFSCSDVGINQVWLIGSDPFGNKDSCLTQVTVVDNNPPVGRIPDVNIDLDNNTSLLSITRNTFPLQNSNERFIGDVCGAVQVIWDDDNGNGILEELPCSEMIGTHDYGYTLRDASGNERRDTASVIVTKTTLPDCRAKNITVPLINGVATIQASDIDDNSAEANACGATVSISRTEFTCADLGHNYVSIYLTDAFGLSPIICLANVTVIDPNDVRILYVDKDATAGANDGSSWEDAYLSLNDATLEAVRRNRQVCTDGAFSIYVAEGTYYPDEGTGKVDNDPTQEFLLSGAGINVYGGFDPQSGIDEFSERDWKQYKTILSGDIDNNDAAPIITDPVTQIIGTNSEHVVMAANFDGTIDGFIITGGSAKNPTTNIYYNGSPAQGGGIYSTGTSRAKIVNCQIVGNQADRQGAGIFTRAPMDISNTVIANNVAGGSASEGGALCHYAPVNLVNATLYNNTAVYGASFRGSSSTLNIANSILWDNRGTYPSYNGSYAVRHSILKAAALNEADQVLNIDPLFVNAAGGDFALQANSPAINRGSNDAAAGSIDNCNQPRISSCNVDIGAIEFQNPGFTTVYVDQKATGFPLGTSWDNAFRYLEDALQCGNVNLINIAEGTYPSLGTSHVINRSVFINGGFPTGGGQRDWENHPTILTSRTSNTSSADHTVLKIINANPTLNGLIIQGGDSQGSSGAAAHGGGIDIINANPSIINSVIRDNNSAGQGGAIYISGSGSAPSFINCLTEGNTSGAGNSIWVSEGTIGMTNCTVADGLASSVINDGFTSSLVNTIVWPQGSLSGTSPIFLEHNLLSASSLPPNASSTSNNNMLGSDPLYIGPDDFRLAAGSPAIDMGRRNSYPNGSSLTFDLEGRPRFQPEAVFNAPIDIGAYEYVAVRCDPTDTIYVDIAAASGGDGSTWMTAYSDLQAALDNACRGVQVWVAAGTNKLASQSASFVTQSDVRLYGGFQSGDTSLTQRDWRAQETILSGDVNNNNSTDVGDATTILEINHDITLDGFVIEHGYGTGTTIKDKNGAGIYNTANPLIKNIVFRNLKSVTPDGAGAAYYNTGGSPTLSQCIFHDNMADLTGSAIYNSTGDISIFNSSFYNNSSLQAAVTNSVGSMTVINCAFESNGQDLSMHQTLGSLVASHNVMEDASLPTRATGTNNVFDTSPLFVNPVAGDFRLQPSSFGRNIGDNSIIAVDDKDFLDTDRIQGFIVDAGAYEGPGIEECAPGTIIYVDASANGTNAGTSWADAFVRLQDAMVIACAGSTIQVAQGSYFPDEGGGMINDDPTARFDLPAGVYLIGGYPTGGSDDRDPVAHPTILDGQIAATIKSRNVVVTSGDGGGLIDGFIIQHGSAPTGGGGLFIEARSATANVIIGNTIFRNNHSDQHGGAVLLLSEGTAVQDSTWFINCIFHDNTSTLHGAAIANNHFGAFRSPGSSAIILDHCTLSQNVGLSTVTTFGVANSFGPVLIENSVISGNNSGLNISSFGGSLSYNHSLIQGRSTVTDGNLSGATDPGWNDPINHDFTINPCSPLVDAGIDLGFATDITGQSRSFGSAPDIGAFELQSAAKEYIEVFNDIVFCEGDTVFIDGVGYTESVEVNELRPVANACDTLVIHSLQKFIEPLTFISEVVCDPNLAGTFLDTLTNMMGCDSIIYTSRSFNIDTAYAGGDSILCSLTYRLAAEETILTNGKWTILSGVGGTLNIDTLHNALLEGQPNTTYELEWSIDNRSCGISRDTVSITLNAPVGVAQAGADVGTCDPSITVGAFPLPLGSVGTWTALPNTGAWSNVNDPNATFTPSALGTYILTWTVTSGTCEDSDDLVATFSAPLTTNAGADQLVCEGIITQLDATLLNPGETGIWQVNPLNGGSYSFPDAGGINDPKANFSGQKGQSYTLTWVISRPGCMNASDEVDIIYGTLEPDAGPDIEACGTTTALQAVAPMSQMIFGQWSVKSGTGGSFNSSFDAGTMFTGTPGETYVLTWTLDDGIICTAGDDVVVSLLLPEVAAAGADMTSCATSIRLMANTPTATTALGTWSVVTGDSNETFGNINDPNSTFSGTAGVTYTLRWTIGYGLCAPTTDDVVVTIGAAAISLSAGMDQDVCGSTTTLAATGLGEWHIVSGAGGVLSNNTNPAATFSKTGSDETFVLEWRNPCDAGALDQVKINLYDAPTAAAGMDLVVCDATTAISATVPTIGAGMWSITSGAGGMIDNPSDASTGFTGVRGTTYELKWTVTNGTCPTAEDLMMITLEPDYTPADAGIDIDVCGNTNTFLSAGVVTTGTGMWQVVSNNAASASITDISSPTSALTGDLDQSYLLEWTVSGGTCSPTKDTIKVSFYDTDVTVDLGEDRTVCGTQEMITADVSAASGAGSLSVLAGAGAMLQTNSNTSFILSGTAGITYQLEYVWNAGTCITVKDTVSITLTSDTQIADAGTDIFDCDDVVQLSGNSPGSADGLWTILSGGDGKFLDSSVAKTYFMGDQPGMYVLQWAIDNGSCIAVDQVSVTLSEDIPFVSAGDNISTCGTTTILDADDTYPGTWTIFSGVGGMITNPSAPAANFTGVRGRQYLLEWTATTSCGDASDLVVIRLDTLSAFAGTTTAVMNPCDTIIELSAPTGFTEGGYWTYAEEATDEFDRLADSLSFNPTFVGTPGETFNITYTYPSVCGAEIYQLQLNFNNAYSLLSAGPDQSICGNTATINAATDGLAVLEWSVISGAGGSFDDASAGSVSFTGVPGSSYVVRLTYNKGGTCETTDDVMISFLENVSAADAGMDQHLCDVTTTLDAVVPTSGTGQWTLVSGAGIIADVNSPISTFSGEAGQTYVLNWVVSPSNSCDNSIDAVEITFNALPSVAFAGRDTIICGDTLSLNADAPLSGIGAWTITDGDGGSFEDATDPNTLFTGSAGEQYTLTWTVDAGSCGMTTDDVNIVMDQTPSVAQVLSAGGVTCDDELTVTAMAPTTGIGRWEVLSGSNGIIDNEAASETRFSSTNADAYILNWTVENGICDASSEALFVFLAGEIVASNAGEDQVICSATAATLNANAAGGGMWQIVSGIGGTLSDPSDPQATFTGSAGETYELRWTVPSAVENCGSEDLTTISFPTTIISNAGDDQIICGTTLAALNANAAAGGMWQIVSGNGGTLSDPSDPQATLTGSAGEVYELSWVIPTTITSCGSDDATMISFPTTVTSNAGEDQVICSTTAATLNATATAGAMWQIVSGNGGSISDPSNPQATLTGIVGEAYELSWIIPNTIDKCGSEDATIIAFTENLPDAPSGIPQLRVCPGLKNIPIDITSVPGTTYQWNTVGVSIAEDNGTTVYIDIPDDFTGGTLSVQASNECGLSNPLEITLEVGSSEWCRLADCLRTSTYVDNAMLTIPAIIDVFKASINISSNALHEDGTLIFKAGESIELFPGFTVNEQASFMAQIESCR